MEPHVSRLMGRQCETRKKANQNYFEKNVRGKGEGEKLKECLKPICLGNIFRNF